MRLWNMTQKDKKDEKKDCTAWQPDPYDPYKFRVGKDSPAAVVIGIQSEWSECHR